MNQSPMNQVLLVDDELMPYLSGSLQQNHPDWIITSVASASEAILKIGEYRFDLVITDWRFPNEQLNGTDVLKAARARDPMCMVIVITAYQGVSMDRYKEGFSYGAYDVIDKAGVHIEFAREVELKAAAALRLRKECLVRSHMARHLDQKVVEAYDTPASLEFRRRWVTVMFCDVRGFTRLTKTLLDKNDRIAEFLKRLYSRTVDVANQWDGIVDKFIGDGSMLLFGATSPWRPDPNDSSISNAACNAVYAALDLKRQAEPIIKDFEEEFKMICAGEWVGLDLAFGINTCEELVGLIQTRYRDQYTALGYGVNLAQRFESAACKPLEDGSDRRGSILITNPVKARLGDRFVLKSEGSLAGLRNIEDKQPAWSVLREAHPYSAMKAGAGENS